MSTITLSDGTVTLVLDPDLYWEDEFRWSAVEQTKATGLTGKPIIQAAARPAGRPITLRPDDEASGWMPRTVIPQLQTWADTPGQRLTLHLRGTDYLVIGRHHDGGMFDVVPVVRYSDPDPTDWVLLTLRLMTVTE